MLQKRVNELGSAILNIKKGKVHIIGFMNEKMLDFHLTKGSQNWSSMGLYDEEEIDYYDIKDDALIIVRKDGAEIGRYQYKPVNKQTIEFKNDNGKMISRTFIIRKSTYSDHFHFYFVISNKEKSFDEQQQSILFDNKYELNQFLKEKFAFQLKE